MKKLFVVGLLVFAGLSIVAAQTSKDITVSATIGKYVAILSVDDLAFGTLDPATGGTKSGNAVIVSNHYAWTVKVYADKGTLTQWDGTAYVTTAGATTIPYTFTFNSASTVATEKIVAQTVPTGAATAATTATFTARTTGDTTGQTFAYKVDVAAATTSWDAANYRDVLHMTVTAN